LLLLGVIFFTATSSYAQEKAPGKHSVIMANFKLPKTLGNKSFKGLMSGLANIDLVYQYNLANGIGFGTGFTYSYYELNGSAFQGTVIGQMEGYNPFLKIAKRKEITENSYVELSVSGGYNVLNTSGNQCSDVFKQEAFNLTPQLGFYMVSSEFLSFGIVVSYNYFAAEFSPANICMTSFPGIDPGHSIGNSHVFSVGFGFSTYLPTK
jgi:hypothetical protein